MAGVTKPRKVAGRRGTTTGETMNIERVSDTKVLIGEGPVWDAEEEVLRFVDLVGKALWTYDPSSGEMSSTPMPEMIAAVSRTTAGRLVVALADGFRDVDRRTGKVTQLAPIDLPVGTQLNDGKVDRQGRFVVGGADQRMKDPIGAIHRLEHDGSITVLDEGYAIANGPCWSPDGASFYCADSIARVIYRYDYDALPSNRASRQVFADTSALGGIPDGATVDAAGDLWIAICGAGKVVRFDPQGNLRQTIEMPTLWVSSVMFGGPELDRLYVTSIDPSPVGLPPDDGCGYLYVVDGLDARGLREPLARLDGR